MKKKLPRFPLLFSRPDGFIYPALYLLFFLYRFYYWENFYLQWLQITLNSAFDVFTVFCCNLLITRFLWVRPLFRQKKWLFIIAFIVTVVLGSLCLKQLHYAGHLLTTGFTEVFRVTFSKWSFQVFDSLIVVTIGSTVAFATCLYTDWNNTRFRYEQLQKEKALTELDFLRSQINPHFVFNTLNSVYFLIDAENREARKSLFTFCELLRYQLYESSAGEIAIEREVSYLRNYVSLQQIRKGGNYEISFEVGEKVSGFKIMPMLLITLVENAFKHVSHHSDRVNRIRVQLDASEGLFSCRVYNTRQDGPGRRGSEGAEATEGIGMNNLMRQLELLYQGRSDLLVKETETDYNATLLLQL